MPVQLTIILDNEIVSTRDRRLMIDKAQEEAKTGTEWGKHCNNWNKTNDKLRELIADSVIAQWALHDEMEKKKKEREKSRVRFI